MDDSNAARVEAVARIKAKQRFRQSLVTYVVVNAALVVIWALGDRGSFWPIWPILGWGIAVVLQAWKVYGTRPITEDEISREMGNG